MKLVNSDHEVLGVVAPPRRGISNGVPPVNPVQLEAGKFGLPVYSYEADDPSKVLSAIINLKADLGIIATLGGEPWEPFTRAFSAGCIGIHPSLLPKYRGPAPISWAILNNEKKTGVTVFRITDKPCAGPLLVQRETMIRPDENWMDLHYRLARIACDAIDAALKTLELHSPYAGVEQDESQATWAPELKESDAYLRFDEPAEVIALRCRAMCPDLVPLNMGELALDDIRPEAGSVQNRARHRPETMHGGALVVAKAVKGVKQGIF
jgi:methionyl-tRNA formyltransferase